MREVHLQTDGQTLLGKLLPPEGAGPFPGALFVHGWGATQRHDLAKARRLTRLGFACLTFNLRGHARTRDQVETVSRAHNFRDALAAYDLLAADEVVDAARIAIAGVSYGGYLGTLLTLERPVRWLALQSLAIYKDRDFDRPKRELNLDGELTEYRRMRLAPEDNRVLAAAARFTGDVLLVEAERDTVIPAPVAANYLDAFRRSAASLTHQIIAGADHALGEDRWRRQCGGDDEGHRRGVLVPRMIAGSASWPSRAREPQPDVRTRCNYATELHLGQQTSQNFDSEIVGSPGALRWRGLKCLAEVEPRSAGGTERGRHGR